MVQRIKQHRGEQPISPSWFIGNIMLLYYDVELRNKNIIPLDKPIKDKCFGAWVEPVCNCWKNGHSCFCYKRYIKSSYNLSLKSGSIYLQNGNYKKIRFLPKE
jgi:hypothetical protein